MGNREIIQPVKTCYLYSNIASDSLLVDPAQLLICSNSSKGQFDKYQAYVCV